MDFLLLYYYFHFDFAQLSVDYKMQLGQNALPSGGATLTLSCALWLVRPKRRATKLHENSLNRLFLAWKKNDNNKY